VLDALRQKAESDPSVLAGGAGTPAATAEQDAAPAAEQDAAPVAAEDTPSTEAETTEG